MSDPREELAYPWTVILCPDGEDPYILGIFHCSSCAVIFMEALKVREYLLEGTVLTLMEGGLN